MKSRLSRFVRGDTGALSVESVIWLPLYFIFLSLIVDVSVLMHHKANAWRIMHDGNRGANVGLYQTPAQAAASMRAKMQIFSDEVQVETIKFGADDEFYATGVSIPAHDLVLVGFFTSLIDIDIQMVGFHLAENCLVDPATMLCAT